MDNFRVEVDDLPETGFAEHSHHNYYAWKNGIAVVFDPKVDIWCAEVRYYTEHDYEVPTDGNHFVLKGTFHAMQKYVNTELLRRDSGYSLVLRPILEIEDAHGGVTAKDSDSDF